MTRRTNKTRKNEKTKRSVESARKLLEGQINAFSPHAAGRKQFDSNSSYTNTTVGRYTTTISTDANGCAAFQVGTLAQAVFRKATTIVSEVVTVDGAWQATVDDSFIQVNQGFRIVSAGFRLYVISPADTTQGWLRVSSNGRLHSLAAFSDFDNTTKRYAIKSGDVYQWTAKPQGSAYSTFLKTDITQAEAEAEEFLFPTTSADCFLVGGPASTSVFGLEVIINYELIPSQDNVATTRAATKPYPHVPSLVAHISKAISDHPHIADAAEMAAAQVAIHKTGILEKIGGWFSGLFKSAAPAIEDGVEMATIAAI